MNVTYEQIRMFLKLVVEATGPEADCDHCMARIAEFADSNLVGKPVPQALACIDEHLENCGYCREEFGFLKAALKGESFSYKIA